MLSSYYHYHVLWVICVVSPVLLNLFRYHSNWTNWLSHHMRQSSCANAENFTTLTRKKSSSAKRQCQGTMLQVENRSLSNKNYETPKDHSNKHPWNCSSTWGMAPHGMKVKKPYCKWMFQVQQYSIRPSTIEFSWVLLYSYIKGSVGALFLEICIVYCHIFTYFSGIAMVPRIAQLYQTWEFHVLWQDLKADHHPTDQSGTQLFQRTRNWKTWYISIFLDH